MNTTTETAPTTTSQTIDHDPSGRGCALAGRVNSGADTLESGWSSVCALCLDPIHQVAFAAIEADADLRLHPRRQPIAVLPFGQDRSPFKSSAYQYIRASDKLPSTDEAARMVDPICRVKLFGGGSWTWFIAGFDPETGMAFGVTKGWETEEGDVDLNEIKALRLAFGLPVERDLHWTPTATSELMKEGTR
jgi:hypothetical protein